jgi:hypothetical protein
MALVVADVWFIRETKRFVGYGCRFIGVDGVLTFNGGIEFSREIFFPFFSQSWHCIIAAGKFKFQKKRLYNR